MSTPLNRPDKTPMFTREGLKAWGIATAILLAFAGVATFAVITTMDMERKKSGFKAIQVEKPISFIDTTYLKDDPQK